MGLSRKGLQAGESQHLCPLRDLAAAVPRTAASSGPNRCVSACSTRACVYLYASVHVQEGARRGSHSATTGPKCAWRSRGRARARMPGGAERGLAGDSDAGTDTDTGTDSGSGTGTAAPAAGGAVQCHSPMMHGKGSAGPLLPARAAADPRRAGTRPRRPGAARCPPPAPPGPAASGRRAARRRRRRRRHAGFRQGQARGQTRRPPRRGPFPAARRLPARRRRCLTLAAMLCPARPPLPVPSLPPLPSLPTAARSFPACAPARQRRPSPLARTGKDGAPPPPGPAAAP